MATFEIRDRQLHLVFSALERLGGLRDGATVPLSDVVSAEVTADPWSRLEGMRVGTGLPWVIVLGTMVRWGSEANDVVAVYGRKPAVIVTLRSGAPYRRLIATVEAPEAAAAQIQAALLA